MDKNIDHATGKVVDGRNDDPKDIQNKMLDQVSKQMGIAGGHKPSNINWEGFNDEYISSLDDPMTAVGIAMNKDPELYKTILTMAYTAGSDHKLVNDVMYFKLGVDVINAVAQSMFDRSKKKGKSS